MQQTHMEIKLKLLSKQPSWNSLAQQFSLHSRATGHETISRIEWLEKVTSGILET